MVVGGGSGAGGSGAGGGVWIAQFRQVTWSSRFYPRNIIRIAPPPYVLECRLLPSHVNHGEKGAVCHPSEEVGTPRAQLLESISLNCHQARYFWIRQMPCFSAKIILVCVYQVVSH